MNERKKEKNSGNLVCQGKVLQNVANEVLAVAVNTECHDCRQGERSKCSGSGGAIE